MPGMDLAEGYIRIIFSFKNEAKAALKRRKIRYLTKLYRNKFMHTKTPKRSIFGKTLGVISFTYVH